MNRVVHCALAIPQFISPPLHLAILSSSFISTLAVSPPFFSHSAPSSSQLPFLSLWLFHSITLWFLILIDIWSLLDSASAVFFLDRQASLCIFNLHTLISQNPRLSVCSPRTTPNHTGCCCWSPRSQRARTTRRSPSQSRALSMALRLPSRSWLNYF